MNYMTIKFPDIANGPGTRASLFVSGCPHHCKGCFNEETWEYNAGQPFTHETVDHLVEILNNEQRCFGFTVLGGEPLCPNNVETVLAMIAYIRKHVTNQAVLDNIWIYSGYTIEELKHIFDINLLRGVSVLVDGRFIEEKKDLSLTYCGSSNQRLIDVDKYLDKDPNFELDKYRLGKYNG